jgi:ribosomal protein S12 methylthiotransferase accessory factor
MLWTEGFDLLSRRPIWLPYESAHANFTLPSPPGSGFFGASTNGLASGNHILEAACHALCEVIERDAVTLWRARSNHDDVRRLDLDTVTDPACRQVLTRLEEADLEIAAFDATSDVGVPAFHAVLLDRRHEGSHPGLGAGCHLAPEIALLRALTEAVQVRMTYITGARDDLSPDEFSDLGRSRKLEPATALFRREGGRRHFGSVVSPPIGGAFAEDLDYLLGRLRTVGVSQIAVVNLTKATFDIPVVKVVVPGLEDADDHEGYVPGPRAWSAGAAP